MTWFKSSDMTATNGSNMVSVDDGAVTEFIQVGDALVIDGYTPQEILAVTSNTIELVDPWPFSTEGSVTGKVMPTAGDLINATAALRNATQVTMDNFKVIQDWGTELGMVTFKGYDNIEYSARTLQQMDIDAP